MKDKRQNVTKVKCKRDESIWILKEYILQKKHLSFAGACSRKITKLYHNQPEET